MGGPAGARRQRSQACFKHYFSDTNRKMGGRKGLYDLVCGGIVWKMEPCVGLSAFKPLCNSYLGPVEASVAESPQGAAGLWSWSRLQHPEQLRACTGVGALGSVLLGRSHHPRRTQSWNWRVNWSKSLSLTLMPSHIDGGPVCWSGCDDGGGGGDDVCDAACAGWGLWVGDFVACGARQGVHSGSAVDLPRTPVGL